MYLNILVVIIGSRYDDMLGDVIDYYYITRRLYNKLNIKGCIETKDQYNIKKRYRDRRTERYRHREEEVVPRSRERKREKEI